MWMGIFYRLKPTFNFFYPSKIDKIEIKYDILEEVEMSGYKIIL